MAELIAIRPSRPQHVRWTLLGLLIALFAYLAVRMVVAGPNQIHCTHTTCWVTIDTPLGDITETHRVSRLAAGDDQIDFGRRIAIERDFQAFLASPSSPAFDASYPDPDARDTSLGLAVILALFVWTLVSGVRGAYADVVIDRAASQVIVRSWPLMFSKRERRGKLDGARADIEVRKVYLVVPKRYLVVRSDYETLLDMRVLGKRDDLAAVRALLQQPA